MKERDDAKRVRGQILELKRVCKIRKKNWVRGRLFSFERVKK